MCRACAAVPQLVLSSSTAVATLYVFSHCDAVSCCRRLEQLMSTGRKMAPLVVGLISVAITILADTASGNWLDRACAEDDSAAYRLPTVLAAVCFLASTAGAILLLSTHLALRRPTKMAEPLLVPLMELKTAAEDAGAGRPTSGDVTVQQTCRISCEAAPVMGTHDTDEFGSWRCFSKMGLLATVVLSATPPPAAAAAAFGLTGKEVTRTKARTRNSTSAHLEGSFIS